MDLLGIPRNDSKDNQGILIVIFGIEIDTFCFIDRLAKEKFDKAGRTIAKVLGQKSISFIDH